MYLKEHVNRQAILLLILAVFLSLASRAAAVGPDSPYFLTNGDSQILQVGQTGTIANSWTTQRTLYSLAVTDTVKLYDRGSGSFGDGIEYMLDGTPTGITFPWQPGPTGQLLDGTTDGLAYNYASEWDGGRGIWQYDLDWKNPTQLFMTRVRTVGITYDQSANTLWISQDDGNIQQVDNAGNVLSEFDPGTGRWGALAWEPSTDTLWAHRNRTDVLAQWAKDGTLLQTVNVAGLSRNIWGGEFQVNTESPILALVDIKPGPTNNTVPLNGNGTLQVAILASDELDVLEIDIASLLFGDPILVDGGATALGATSDRLRDLNHDGLDDLLVGFSISDLVDGGALAASSVEGRLTGELFDGTPIIGSDIVRMVPQNNGGGGLVSSAVPEPTTLALAVLGLLGVGWRRRERV